MPDNCNHTQSGEKRTPTFPSDVACAITPGSGGNRGGRCIPPPLRAVAARAVAFPCLWYGGHRAPNACLPVRRRCGAGVWSARSHSHPCRCGQGLANARARAATCPACACHGRPGHGGGASLQCGAFLARPSPLVLGPGWAWRENRVLRLVRSGGAFCPKRRRWGAFVCAIKSLRLARSLCALRLALYNRGCACPAWGCATLARVALPGYCGRRCALRRLVCVHAGVRCARGTSAALHVPCTRARLTTPTE